MARRYNDINRARQLEAARVALAAYRDELREPRIGLRGPQDPRKPIYTKPFGILVDAEEVAKSSVATDHYPILAPLINQAGTGAEVVDNRGTSDIAKVFRYTPPRIVWFRNTTVSFIEKRSDRTNQKYRKYAGESYRCGFGKKLTADTIFDSFQKIKAVIDEQTGFEMSRVSLTREKVTLS